MAQKEPMMKMPSAAANEFILSEKLALAESHHLSAQLALRWLHGTV
jgi:hypothetical protein